MPRQAELVVVGVEVGRIAGAATERGRIRASAVMVAGGAWSSMLLRRHGIESRSSPSARRTLRWAATRATI